MLSCEQNDYELTRDFGDMYGLLSNRSAHDFTMVSQWRPDDPGPDVDKITQQDIVLGIEIAAKIYKEAKAKCSTMWGSAKYPVSQQTNTPHSQLP